MIKQLGRKQHPALVGGYNFPGEFVDYDHAVNGGFDTDTGWNKQPSWTIAGGVAHCDGTQGATEYIDQDILVIGRKYRATYTVLNRTGGTSRLNLGTTGLGTTRNSNGTFIEDIICGGSTSVFMRGGVGFEADVDNISIELLYTPDYSGRAYHGSVVGATATPWGYTFDGDSDYITVGNMGENALTMLSRFKPAAVINAALSAECLFDLRNSNNDGVFLGDSTGLLANDIISVHDAGGGRSGWLHASDEISTEWHELAIRWNPNVPQYDIILDGIAKPVTTAGTPIVLAADNVVFYIRQNIDDREFSGDGSFMAIYKESLTDMQIREEFGRRPNFTLL